VAAFLSLPHFVMTLPAHLSVRLTAAFRSVLPDLAPDFSAAVAPAADTRYGDYQSNAAMTLAKAVGKNPRALATEVVAALDVAGLSAPATIAGPGFINFTIPGEVLAPQLESLLTDARLGVAQLADPKTVVIDFSGPNVAKQMHVGHIRSTIIGDCLARVGRFLGHRIVTDNHIGDWGTQFGMVLYGWKHFRDDAAVAADPIRELLRIYKHVNALQKDDETIRDQAKAELVKLQAGDPENRDIWRLCVDISLRGLNRIYDTLDVTFDHTLGESAFNARLSSLVEEFLAKGLAEESEGAVCVFFHEVPGIADKAPMIIRKRDGGFGYATTDLATVEQRVNEWQAEEIWYVVGAPQALHLQQVFEASRRWGFPQRMEHIAFGSILGADGKIMRTREGESVGLIEVLDEAIERARAVVEEKNADLPEEEKTAIAEAVGLGAVKYLELSQTRLSDYKFSWEKMLAFQGNTAPYLQFAYVRTRAIFRKLEAGTTEAIIFAGPYALVEDAERRLALKLVQYAEVVPTVLDGFRPNLLAQYLYELATTLHTFTEACHVLRSEGVSRATRLALCEVTSRILRHGLDLLGIRVTEKM
jgi:arginyl-tRNA synthetase